jgi:hypothetical protein
MRVIIILFISALSSSLLCVTPQTTSIPLTHGTLNFTIYVNNSQEARSNNSTLVAPTQISKIKEESRIAKKLADLWIDPISKQTLTERINASSSSFLSSHKWQLLAGAMLGSYGWLYYFIFSGNQYLGNKELWSSWRQELPLDQLLAIPQPQFAQELLREIQRRYTDPAAVTDLVRPLGTFMKMIDEEEENIRWYQNIFSWLSYVKLTKLIPTSTTRFGKIPERLQRIAYYKNAFHTWAAEYQMNTIARSIKSPSKPCKPEIHDFGDRWKLINILRLHQYWDNKCNFLIPRFE